MSEVALVLEGIEKGYNRGKPSEVIVLRGATVQVARGEVVAEKGRFGLRIVSLVGEDGQDVPPAPAPAPQTDVSANPATLPDEAL